MAHCGQSHIVTTLFRFLTEYLYDMNESVLIFMEKCNVYILLRQSLNKSNWHPFITHELFFHQFSFLSLFLLLQVIIKNLKVRREHELTCAREEYSNLQIKGKTEKILLQQNE